MRMQRETLSLLCSYRLSKLAGLYAACIASFGIVAFASGQAIGQASGQASADRPNIVLILADDLGYGDVQCYNDQAKVATPQIDQLARQGMRFTDAHSPCTVCTPTRYGLMTGQMPFRIPNGGTVFTGVGGPSFTYPRLPHRNSKASQVLDLMAISLWSLIISLAN